MVWDSAPVTVSADEALAPVMGRTKLQPALTDAEDFLRLVLGAGPLPAKHVKAEASDAGVSGASLRRAAETLGVKATPNRRDCQHGALDLGVAPRVGP